MGNLGTLGIFFAGFFGGLGVFLAACGLLWWCSLYQKIKDGLWSQILNSELRAAATI